MKNYFTFLIIETTVTKNDDGELKIRTDLMDQVFTLQQAEDEKAELIKFAKEYPSLAHSVRIVQQVIFTDRMNEFLTPVPDNCWFVVIQTGRAGSCYDYYVNANDYDEALALAAAIHHKDHVLGDLIHIASIKEES